MRKVCKHVYTQLFPLRAIPQFFKNGSKPPEEIDADLLFTVIQMYYILIVTMSKKVLLIDNTISYSTSTRLLVREGYHVDVVRNSDAGLQHLDARAYDVIIVKENHESESWQLCQKIRRRSGRPLIVINTNASPVTSVKALNAGADYFIRKPFSPLELLARVQCLLRRTSLNQSVTVGS